MLFIDDLQPLLDILVLRTAIAPPVWRGGSSAILLVHRTRHWRRISAVLRQGTWIAPAIYAEVLKLFSGNPAFWGKKEVIRLELCIAYCWLRPLPLLECRDDATGAGRQERKRPLLHNEGGELWHVYP